MTERFDLDVPEGSAPLFSRIAQAIADEIVRGRLVSGQRLPGTRNLAGALGVHRNTVVAAYRELGAQGWTETRRATATIVSASIPERHRKRTAAGAPPRRTAYSLTKRHRTRPARDDTAAFNLAGGLPDPRLAPKALLGRAMGRVLRRGNGSVLQYGDPRGHPALRAAIAQMLVHNRGLTISADDVVITRGSQMALYVLAGVIVDAGDTVAVESLGYQPAWGALQAHGAVLSGVPVDGQGLDVAQLMRRPTPRAVYVTPHHQYPTTVALSADRRLQLLNWAAERRVAIIEDDYDNEYHYDGQPLLPLAATDRRGSVAYVGTLSKVVAPGLRIGWVVGPPNLIERVVRLRSLVDAQGGLASEAAVADLLDDGELQRHVWRTKRIYAERRDALADALRRRLGNVLSFRAPAGGMALWATVDPELDVTRWAAAARDRGVCIGLGQHYALDGKARNNVRLGFARHDPKELEAATRSLAAALPARAR